MRKQIEALRLRFDKVKVVLDYLEKKSNSEHELLVKKYQKVEFFSAADERVFAYDG